MALEGQQNGDLRATLALSQAEALVGTRRTLNLPQGRQITVSIPAGTRDGQEIRLEGQGNPSSTSETRGALILTIAIAPAQQPDSQRYPPEGTDLPTQIIEASSTLLSSSPPTKGAYSLPGPGGGTFIAHPPQYTPGYFPQTGTAPAYTRPEQYRQPPERQHHRRLSAGIILLLIVLLGGASGFIYYTAVYRPAQLQTQSTAQANAQSTTQAVATIQAQAHATTTAQALAQTQATATATALQNIYTQATSGQPALNDPLSGQDAYKWSEGIGCAFTNGTYHASDSTTANFIYCIAQATNFSNFAYQVQMTILTGDYGGIVFRADATNTRFYFFRMNQNGAYDLYLYVDKTGTNAQTLTSGSTTAIHPGLNQTNLITVVARSNNLYFYVNKQFVTHVSDSTYSSGQIGIAANDLNNSTEVAFSQAQVWDL